MTTQGEKRKYRSLPWLIAASLALILTCIGKDIYTNTSNGKVLFGFTQEQLFPSNPDSRDKIKKTISMKRGEKVYYHWDISDEDGIRRWELYVNGRRLDYAPKPGSTYTGIKKAGLFNNSSQELSSELRTGKNTLEFKLEDSLGNVTAQSAEIYVAE